MKRLDAGSVFFVIVGVLFLALAAAIAFSAYQDVKILGFLVGAAGIAAVIAGLLSGGVLGAVLSILAVSVVVRFIEAFPVPLAIVLGLAGIGITVFGLKGAD